MSQFNRCFRGCHHFSRRFIHSFGCSLRLYFIGHRSEKKLSRCEMWCCWEMCMRDPLMIECLVDLLKKHKRRLNLFCILEMWILYESISCFILGRSRTSDILMKGFGTFKAYFSVIYISEDVILKGFRLRDFLTHLPLSAVEVGF